MQKRIKSRSRKRYPKYLQVQCVKWLLYFCSKKEEVRACGLQVRGGLAERAGWVPAQPCPAAVKVGSPSELPPTADFWKGM